MPTIKTIQLNATIYIPQEATPEQVKEWISYHLSCANGISADNPLFEEDSLFAETISIKHTLETTGNINSDTELEALAEEFDGEVSLSNPTDTAKLPAINAARKLVQQSTDDFTIVIPNNVQTLWSGEGCGEWLPAMVYIPNKAILGS